jgi:hypothetical protein
VIAPTISPMAIVFGLSVPAILHWVILLWLDAMVRLFSRAYGGFGLKVDLAKYPSGITNVP